MACVRRNWQPLKIEAYRMPLQQPLPTISVPLDQDYADVPLRLQDLVTQVYRNGRYDDIDYRQEPQPPLPPKDAAWADELLHSQGLR
jgi:hypothetical protein